LYFPDLSSPVRAIPGVMISNYPDKAFFNKKVTQTIRLISLVPS
jgi:hypothetical protein